METTAAATASITASKGFESLADETRIDSLPVRGALPPWLQGSLIRTGPAKWEVGERSMNHWFDGLAMLHRFSFDAGGVSYANRFLETRAYRAARDTNEISYSEFATDPCRSLFQRVTAMFSPKISDNANVNLVKLGEQFIAMTETPIPVQFDPDTLAAAGVPYRAPGQVTTAHPHMDRASGGMLNYAAKLGPRSSYRFFLVRPGSDSPEQIGSAPVREPAYMHSFGLTPRWLVLAEFPFVVNPPSLVLSGRPYIENFRWKPERGTRFHLFDRSTGQVAGPFTTDARFAFHHVNAFEERDDVVVDVCTYADPRVVRDLYLDRLREGKPVQEAHLERFRISPGSGEVTSERLLDEPLELARINYMRCNERPYQYLWGVGIRDGWLGTIVKGDVLSRATTVWAEDGCYPGEPVFVARPDGDAEDDGVLLSVVLDGRSERSFLLVLDAGSLEELGRAEVPHHIPFGFHGQYVR